MEKAEAQNIQNYTEEPQEEEFDEEDDELKQEIEEEMNQQAYDEEDIRLMSRQKKLQKMKKFKFSQINIVQSESSFF